MLFGGAGDSALGTATDSGKRRMGVEVADNEFNDSEVCRVCRSEDGALFYPCMCTGSIKYVHQDCLMEWLKHSKKDVCELCHHKYSFQPIYRSDMPKRLPFAEILKGRVTVSTQDCMKGCVIVAIFICTFISLVWLREQIQHGPNEWLQLAQDLNDPQDADMDNVAEGGHNEDEHNAPEPVVNNWLEEDMNQAQGDQQVAELGDGAAQGDLHDWDRVADDLTWQRLLGLDGSFLFLEHVFWVVALNTLFTVVFASFVLILREVLRPGLLWFLRNINDPDFNPIQEMIDQPVVRHVRRMLASTVMFFTTILLVVHLPMKLAAKLFPKVLPYNLFIASESPINEFSMELLLLQVVFPVLLEHTQAVFVLRGAVAFWCRHVGRILDLDRYLLPDDGHVGAAEENDNAREAAGAGLAAQHQALLHMREPTTFQPYAKPSYFPLRIAALLGLMAATSSLISFLLTVIPVSVGRFAVSTFTGITHINDLYTSCLGVFICWFVARGVWLLSDWASSGWAYFVASWRSLSWQAFRVLLVTFPLFFVIPIMVGLTLQLYLMWPLRLGYQQSAVYTVWNDWAMGIVQCKLISGLIMLGPDWWMRNVFEQIYADGLRNMRVAYLYSKLICPAAATCVGLICSPYVFARLILTPMFDLGIEEEILVVRYSYPFVMFVIGLISFVLWQYSKLMYLVQKIRNEKYLVGTRLVNYERKQEALAEPTAE
ncbi:hypothetical protein QR680_009232 [Steinernema hermaphroditum]|uniref:RING-type E3 ubiquitin transferase n=1 Tax=Steinernema hermaphroditum TaxID=289476 RepID=A0AA39IJH0_9BILA|nr:hypothetical protein QR680_009232 [Steinernema hermaphroditum]